MSPIHRVGLVIMVLLGLAIGLSPTNVAVAGDLPRSSPEEQGISSAAIQEFVAAADKNIDSLHSFMLVRHGHVVAESWWAPYSPDTRHQLYSLSKSFTSTAVGIAIEEGKLNLDDPVLKFFPDDAPAEPSANLKSMRVSDLLRMNTGHQTEPPRPADQSWTKAFLAHDVPFKPGTHFLYNTSATYMLSAIVQKATGQTLLDYLQPRLFEPLGIEQPTWEQSPQGVSTGGYGLSVRTGDIARFGQLYLQRGQWEGKQLVPAAWIDAATARQTSNGSNPNSDWDQGYGYQFWRCRHGAYRGDGAFGQYCIVLPEQDAVIAITSGLGNMQSVLDLVWEKLLPAMQPKAIASDEAALKSLRTSLAKLSLKTPEPAAEKPKATAAKYVFPENDQKVQSLSLASENGSPAVITLVVDGAEQRIVCGRGTWEKGLATLGQRPEQPLAACGAWTADDTFSAKVCFVETPFVATLRLKFADGELRYTTQTNVGFGPNRERELIGKAE